MLRKMPRRGGIGLIAGVALEHVIALLTSIILRMGYYSPCLVSLPERVGGEINAVIWQTALCALFCGVVGAFSVFLSARRLRTSERWIAFSIPVALCALLILIIFPK